MNPNQHKLYSLFVRQILLHLIIAVFFALFGAVYELFSHEVYSYYMLYAFATPLVLGAFPASIMLVLDQKSRVPVGLTKRMLFFWNCGILTLTIGCAFQGVLEIYGTSSRLVIVYPIAGILLLAVACCIYFISEQRHRITRKPLSR